MNRIIVTPAGRAKNLEVLFLNLIKNKKEFDCWHIWCNTNIKEDVLYINSLADCHNWISVKNIDQEITDLYSTIGVFMINHSIKNDDLYLRLDDDICFIEAGAIEKVFSAREADKSSPLIYGNILNNSVIQYHQQQQGLFKDFLKFEYDCMHKETWASGPHAEQLHNLFFQKLIENNLDYFYIEDYAENAFIRTSVNAVSYRGDMNHLYRDIVKHNEEEFLSVTLPKEINIPNVVLGNALFVHYSFHPQKEHLDKTNILEKYLGAVNED